MQQKCSFFFVDTVPNTLPSVLRNELSFYPLGVVHTWCIVWIIRAGILSAVVQTTDQGVQSSLQNISPVECSPASQIAQIQSQVHHATCVFVRVRDTQSQHGYSNEAPNWFRNFFEHYPSVQTWNRMPWKIFEHSRQYSRLYSRLCAKCEQRLRQLAFAQNSHPFFSFDAIEYEPRIEKDEYCCRSGYLFSANKWDKIGAGHKFLSYEKSPLTRLKVQKQ